MRVYYSIVTTRQIVLFVTGLNGYICLAGCQVNPPINVHLTFNNNPL
nr:MAG TPA: hypothetical protein [Caudoviricetes sp.]